MNSPAVRVEALGKRYRIGAKPVQRDLRETAMHLLRAFGKTRQERSNNDDETVIWALRDVSFELSCGEILGVIGRNGSGKSTLLRILSRITDPTVGCAEIFGRVGSLLEVGTGFHPELTGRENIYLNGAILGMKKKEIDQRFGEMVAFAEMGEMLDTPVKHYSTGMYARLAFSVAAHLDPDILIVDEVLSVGDALFQRKCIGKMENSALKGRTVIFVSHNADAVVSLCTRALLLEAGRIVADGPPREVTDMYLARQPKAR